MIAYDQKSLPKTTAEKKKAEINRMGESKSIIKTNKNKVLKFVDHRELGKL